MATRIRETNKSERRELQRGKEIIFKLFFSIGTFNDSLYRRTDSKNRFRGQAEVLN